MRVINVETYAFEEYLGFPTDPYAILSHTWGDEEVTYQEWAYLLDNNINVYDRIPDGSINDSVKRKSGYAKIIGACREAHNDGLQYLWCDTVCIDKTSSADVSESINGMFRLYRDSQVCYAYLSDVGDDVDMMAGSRWFTRGWTLQELLAPKKLSFYGCNWVHLGDKDGLVTIISDITNIHVGALENRNTIFDYSIAQRMSWAANRQTTIKEDIAYCLWGIFEVNMLPQYGEGLKAFERLQQAIIERTDDQSIFAWDFGKDSQPVSGALAPSPDYFSSCGSIVRDFNIRRYPYQMTEQGIFMTLQLCNTVPDGILLAGLNCAHELREQNSPVFRRFRVWIWLRSNKEETRMERVHIFNSRMHLEPSYIIDAPPFNLDLPFISTTDVRQDQQSSITGLLPALDAGFLITVGSGIVDPQTDTYEKSYPLEHFSTTVLRSRGCSTLSHALVSSGSFSTVLSIAWNEQEEPQDWCYTTFHDPEKAVSRQMAQEKQWACLFSSDEGDHSKSEDSNSTSELYSLHEKIEETVGKLEGTLADTSPFVVMEKEALEDSHGQLKVVVRVVLRERPMEASVAEAYASLGI